MLILSQTLNHAPRRFFDMSSEPKGKPAVVHMHTDPNLKPYLVPVSEPYRESHHPLRPRRKPGRFGPTDLDMKNFMNHTSMHVCKFSAQ
jgi:hypothetical protein